MEFAAAVPGGEFMDLVDLARLQGERWSRQLVYVAARSQFYKTLWNGRQPDGRIEALGELPFTDVLSEETIAPALDAIDACWKDRIYPPLVTLWVFLGQVISADHSCRAAVARLIVHRLSRGQQACSARTGAYCQARKRLPEQFFSTIARSISSKRYVARRLPR